MFASNSRSSSIAAKHMLGKVYFLANFPLVESFFILEESSLEKKPNSIPWLSIESNNTNKHKIYEHYLIEQISNWEGKWVIGIS